MAAKLEAESRRAGQSFREIVNETCGGHALPLILVDATCCSMLIIREPNSTRKAELGSKLCSRGPDLVRFAWLTLWAFLRIATNPRVDRPLSTSEAETAISSWLAQPTAGILEPG
jgi:hypothetical protein